MDIETLWETIRDVLASDRLLQRCKWQKDAKVARFGMVEKDRKSHF